jgi:transcriptional regulator with XRE-family HTH domain
MEISIVGSIRTPFGEVVLIPQDRNLLLASSPEPLQFGGNKIHLWAMLEQLRQTWGVSGAVEPLLHMIDGSGRASSIVGASIAAELLKSVTLLAGDWAVAHPEAFECAAARSIEFDKEGLYRELESLKESLTCSAQAIESITSEATSEQSARLREYSQKMRRMAFDVPLMQKVTQAISYPSEDPSLKTELLHLPFRGAAAGNTEKDQPGDVSGLKIQINPSPPSPGQSPSISQLTLGQLLKKQRKDLGLSQRELALKLGVKPGHIAQLETDCCVRPSFQLLSRVASILGLQKDRLFQLAETAANSSSGARRVVFHPTAKAQRRREFARNHALLDSHHVEPRELKALSEVSLMGKITGSATLLFILEAIRDSRDLEE